MSNIKCNSSIKCEYSVKKAKCIKPNPYIEYISKCKRDNINRDECELSYKLNKTIASKNACKNYLSRIAIKRKEIFDTEISNPNDKLKNLKLKEKELLQELKNIEKERKNKLKELQKKVSDTSRYSNTTPIKFPLPVKKSHISLNNSDEKKENITPVYKSNKTIPNFLEYRNTNYKIINNHINSRKKYSNNCFKVYKVINNIPIFRIGNRIILTKKIGSDSAYGVVYFSYYIDKNEGYNKDLIFATKLIEGTRNNLNEYYILETLTLSVINNEFIHFPITYGLLECYDKSLESKYVSLNITKHKSLERYIPENIAKLDNLFIILSELANGDLEHFYKYNYNNDEIMLNALIQIFLSLMFFYKKINAFHADAHNGNFLYYKIKPGGYFHYNIYGVDYYLKNVGYLWVIWDFGLIKPFSNSNIINNNKYGIFTSYEKINSDYEYILKSFKNTNIGGWVSNTFPLSFNINNIINNLAHLFNLHNNYDIYKIPELNIQLLTYLISNIPSVFTFNKPVNIINNKPYILN